jgi:multidrug/hemolysin transport system permease protein
MSKYISLTKRNCLVFLRDRSSVFFSLLSMLIVMLLTTVFLGNLNVTSITNLLAEYGGIRDTAVDTANAKELVWYWTLAGILVVNSLTVSLTVIGLMITDSNENRLEAFYTAPISKSVVALSYVTSAILIGTLFCVLTLVIALIYIAATGGTMLSLSAILQILFYIFINVCIFSIIMYLAALFVKTPGAWSGIATIVGTLVGFLGAIYLPMGSLPDNVGKVLTCLPILHGTSLMRKVCCESILTKTFEGIPQEVLDVCKQEMGITISMNNTTVSTAFQLTFMVICGAMAFVAALIVAKHKHLSDR